MSAFIHGPFQQTFLNASASSNDIAGGKALLKRVNILFPGATSPRIQIWDSLTAGAGTLLFDTGTTGPPSAQPYEIEVPCQAGISVTLAGTTPPAVQIIWRKMN